MPTVRVSETYDLSTQVDKMGIIGIHTPTGPLISRLYPGLIQQYSKFKFKRCDITMACASLLPADPLQIGIEAGDIAPQDMFNPILYKAVSNDSMNQFLQYVQAISVSSGDSSVTDLNKNSVVDINDTDFGGSGVDQFAIYYALLSNAKGWRKAMPQAGLQMRGLKPLVYQVVSPYGLNGPDTTVGPGFDGDIGEETQFIGNNYLSAYATSGTSGRQSLPFAQTLYRGRSMPMPGINTKYFTVPLQGDSDSESGYQYAQVYAGLGNNLGRVPPAYVGLIVVPPARLNRMYYRMRVTWTVDFYDLQASTEYYTFQGLGAVGEIAYGTDYDVQSSTMSSLNSMVDVDGADVYKIMEGA